MDENREKDQARKELKSILYRLMYEVDNLTEEEADSYTIKIKEAFPDFDFSPKPKGAKRAERFTFEFDKSFLSVYDNFDWEIKYLTLPKIAICIDKLEGWPSLYDKILIDDEDGERFETEERNKLGPEDIPIKVKWESLTSIKNMTYEAFAREYNRLRLNVPSAKGRYPYPEFTKLRDAKLVYDTFVAINYYCGAEESSEVLYLSEYQSARLREMLDAVEKDKETSSDFKERFRNSVKKALEGIIKDNKEVLANKIIKYEQKGLIRGKK